MDWITTLAISSFYSLYDFHFHLEFHFVASPLHYATLTNLSMLSTFHFLYILIFVFIFFSALLSRPASIFVVSNASIQQSRKTKLSDEFTILNQKVTLYSAEVISLPQQLLHLHLLLPLIPVHSHSIRIPDLF